MLFGGDKKRLAVPYFIGFYCVAIAIGHWLPQGETLYQILFSLAKRLLIVCLFFIGAGITVNKMRQAGHKPLLLGVLLWLAIGGGSLIYIISFT